MPLKQPWRARTYSEDPKNFTVDGSCEIRAATNLGRLRHVEAVETLQIMGCSDHL